MGDRENKLLIPYEAGMWHNKEKYSPLNWCLWRCFDGSLDSLFVFIARAHTGKPTKSWLRGVHVRARCTTWSSKANYTWSSFVVATDSSTFAVGCHSKQLPEQQVYSNFLDTHPGERTEITLIFCALLRAQTRGMLNYGIIKIYFCTSSLAHLGWRHFGFARHFFSCWLNGNHEMMNRRNLTNEIIE